MKLYVSRFLKSVSIFYLTFPVSFIFLAAVLFDIPPQLCPGIVFSPVYFLISVLAVVTGYGLWEVRKWAWYFFVAVNFLVALECLSLISNHAVSHHKWLAFATAFSILAYVTVRLAREIRVPYFFPKIRWWESNPRYKLSVPVAITRQDGTSVEAQILDLSMGGCFVKVRHDLDQHELIGLAFSAFGFKMECKGTVVWRTKSTVTLPKGLGVKFEPLERPVKRNLRQITLRLQKIAKLYARSRYLLNQEEFLKRLQKIEEASTEKKRLFG